MNIRQILLCTFLSTVTVAAVMADGDSMIHVNIDEVLMIEDLQPIDGITSSGQPDAKAFALVAESGYVAVIDMRGPSENRGLNAKAVVEELGLEYIEFPLVGSESISFANAKQLDALLNDIDGPVLLHCGSGNRVGAILALRHSLQGAGDEDAMQYGKSAGLTSLEPVVKDRLEHN
jgi:uncharacterized protein (TIGR01244 family)